MGIGDNGLKPIGTPMPDPVSLQQEFIRHVKEHEVFIAFDGDSDAECWREWWDAKGWSAYMAYRKKWMKENKR